MLIRPETPDDHAAITALTEAAFKDAPHSGGNEAAIVTALREDGALTLSLVAEDGGTVIGHVSFSPVSVTGQGAGWFGLGPVSVAPAHQGKGVGAGLIRAGLDALRNQGATGCVVLGDPAYYPRFGFVAGGLSFADVPAQYFMAQTLDGSALPAGGAVTYHPAFTG